MGKLSASFVDTTIKNLPYSQKVWFEQFCFARRLKTLKFILIITMSNYFKIKKMWLWPNRGWLARVRLSSERDLNAEETSAHGFILKLYSVREQFVG